MENKTIRKAAIEWFKSKYEIVPDEIYTSKFYPPQDSWSKTRVWFFQIPTEVLYNQSVKKIHLLCENHLGGERFIYLKIPSLFFLKHLKSFDVDTKEDVVRIYLSAEAVSMFTEVRGTGKVDFKEFQVN